MALFIQNQKVYVSHVETKESQKGKSYVNAQASFLSSKKETKDGKDEYVNDTPFFVKLTCFSDTANKIIANLPENKGFIEVSGKISSETFKNKAGEDVKYDQLTVFSAQMPEPKKSANAEKKEAVAASSGRPF